MALSPLEKKRTFEIVAKRIVKFIKEEKLVPGDKLPTERYLSEQLQVSRSSVREAFRVLEVLGFIELRSGEGTFVNDPLNNSVLSHFYTDFNDLNWYLELLEARNILERNITYLAAERAGPEHIEKLENILESMKEKIKKGVRPDKENTLFHQTIWNASQNRFLSEVVTTLFNFIFEKESVLNYQHKVSDNFIKDHYNILKAIKDKQPNQAAEAMLEHHVTIQDTIIEQFKGKRGM